MIDRENIIRMAQEAGWEMDDSCVLEPQVVWYISQGQLERFAALVAAAEREACAKVSEEGCFLYDDSPEARFGKACAAAIRKRGQV